MTPACYACGAPVRRRSIGANDMVVCRRCGMGEIDADASSDYWSRRADGAHELTQEYWTAGRHAMFHRALDRLGPPGMLVDVGGGVGYFAEMALGRGWDAYSLDVSALASAEAAARIGPARALTELPSALAGRCSAVTMWCVVAHVRDPRRLLADALSLLRADGRLLVTAPNFAFQARYAEVLHRLGRRLDFVAHDHTMHYTPKALRTLLRQAGAGTTVPTWLGASERCLSAPGLDRGLVPAKRAWNRAAFAAVRAGLPNACSELQVLATVASG